MEKLLMILAGLGGIYWLWETHPIITIILGLGIAFIISIISDSKTKRRPKSKKSGSNYDDNADIITTGIDAMINHN